jgi:hypothetical protein
LIENTFCPELTATAKKLTAFAEPLAVSQS